MDSLKLKIEKLEERIAPWGTLGLGAITSVNLGLGAVVGVQGASTGDTSCTHDECSCTCNPCG